MKTTLKLIGLCIAFGLLLLLNNCSKEQFVTAPVVPQAPYAPTPCDKYDLCVPFRYSPTYMPYGGVWSNGDPVTIEVPTDETPDWTGSLLKFTWNVNSLYFGLSYISDGNWTATKTMEPTVKKVTFQYKGTAGLQLLVHAFPISSYHLGWTTVTCSNSWQTGVMTLTSSAYIPLQDGPFTVERATSYVVKKGETYVFYIKNIVFE